MGRTRTAEVSGGGDHCVASEFFVRRDVVFRPTRTSTPATTRRATAAARWSSGRSWPSIAGRRSAKNPSAPTHRPSHGRARHIAPEPTTAPTHKSRVRRLIGAPNPVARTCASSTPPQIGTSILWPGTQQPRPPPRPCGEAGPDAGLSFERGRARKPVATVSLRPPPGSHQRDRQFHPAANPGQDPHADAPGQAHSNVERRRRRR